MVSKISKLLSSPLLDIESRQALNDGSLKSKRLPVELGVNMLGVDEERAVLKLLDKLSGVRPCVNDASVDAKVSKIGEVAGA